LNEVFIIALVAIVILPLVFYLVSRQMITLGQEHAKQLDKAYADARAEVQEMSDRLMEMVNVQHWTRGTLEELSQEQMAAFENPKPPIEMDEEEEDYWAQKTWGQANDVAEDVGAEIADVLGAAGVELEVDGLSN
jgi:hypothetical protein